MRACVVTGLLQYCSGTLCGCMVLRAFFRRCTSGLVSSAGKASVTTIDFRQRTGAKWFSALLGSVFVRVPNCWPQVSTRFKCCYMSKGIKLMVLQVPAVDYRINRGRKPFHSTLLDRLLTSDGFITPPSSQHTYNFLFQKIVLGSSMTKWLGYTRYRIVRCSSQLGSVPVFSCFPDQPSAWDVHQ